MYCLRRRESGLSLQMVNYREKGILQGPKLFQLKKLEGKTLKMSKQGFFFLTFLLQRYESFQKCKTVMQFNKKTQAKK